MASGSDTPANNFKLNIQPPTSLDLNEKDKAENWKAFKQRWQNYSILTHLDKQPEECQVALFLYSIGTEAVKKYNSFDLSEDDRKSLKPILEAFDKFAIGEKNEIYERYLFNTRDQKEGESIEEYLTQLRTLAQSCGFCTCMQDTLIRDRIVLGTRDSDARKQLLESRDLTLKQCIDICRSKELAFAHLQTLNKAKNTNETLHKIQEQNRGARPKSQSKRMIRSQFDTSEMDQKSKCRYCGKNHKFGRNSCPAWGKTCSTCGKRNHFAEMCMQKEKIKQKKAHEVFEEYDYESSSESDYTGSVTASHVYQPINGIDDRHRKAEAVYAEMIVNGHRVKFHIDCGATVNVLPFRYLNNHKISPTTKALVMWNKTKLKPKGVCSTSVINPKTKKRYSVEFVVVEENLTPLLGYKTIQQMDIIEIKQENFKSVSTINQGDPNLLGGKSDIVKQFHDVFEGELGTLKGEQHLTVDPAVTPTVSPSRRIPFALKDKLQTELNRLTDMQVITPIDEPTDWVSNVVTVTKPSGDLRICIDPGPLNQALKRERYPIPVIDDVLPDLAKAKLFTKADAKNGYWHVVLDDESSKLTTFDTPFGRYRWKRMPFGLSVASEIFQKRLNQALDKLDGLLTVHDDLVIYGVGETDEEARRDHDTKLIALLKRCRQQGIKLNKDKLKLRCTEITYLGHLVTNEGLKADPEKVEAIQKMPRPEDLHGVRRLCGFVNYLARFLPNITDTLEPIRQLTRQGVKWQWGQTHEKAFQRIKEMVSTAPLLRYYNPKEELTIQCDASDKGIGAALLQQGQPVAFASRALTDTETRYAPIEKEMLAVVFSLNKFNQYVFGRHVTVNSDHKPLEAIAKKPLRNAPKRLQTMLLKAQKYDVTITYLPGSKMYIADTLSRAYITGRKSKYEEVEHVNAAKFVLMSDKKKEMVRRSTEKDEVLQQLKDVILGGWPEERATLPATLTPYFSYRDELAVHDGLIYRGERLVIPKDLRPLMRKEIHSSHIGINGCLRRARESMFWPSMSAELKEFIAQCETCQLFESRQQKETLRSHPPTDRPWEKVGVDLAALDNKNYLITVDYFSNFWEIDRLDDTKASTVVRKLKCQFARYGIPDTVISDNGPQFTSEEFHQFSEDWEFDHFTSSPGHQQANGKAEAAVKAVKHLLRKAKVDKADPYLAILAHRNTPAEGMDSSPSQRLHGRRTKTLLPSTTELLKPQRIDPERVKSKTKNRQETQAHYYNRKARDLEPLEEGDTVRMRPFKLNQKVWEKATVTKRLDDRSYEVATPDQASYRRNRIDLRRTMPTTLQPKESPPEEVKETLPEDAEVNHQPQQTRNIPTQPQQITTRNLMEHERPQRARREPAYLKDYEH